MKSKTTFIPIVSAVFALAAVPALADHAWFQGRTGLPTVRDAKNDVWMERGLVHLRVVGNTLEVTQDFRLRMPGPGLEKAGKAATIAFREDYYRGHHEGATPMTRQLAQGFTRWRAWIDGSRANPMITEWEMNDKKDTATRWRNLRLHFYPGQMRTVKVVSVSPLGKDVNHRTIEFVSKDLGHWRGNPDYLEIRVTMPGVTEAFLTTLEPKAESVGRNGIRWVYRKADPNRDVMIKLPEDWRSAQFP